MRFEFENRKPFFFRCVLSPQASRGQNELYERYVWILVELQRDSASSITFMVVPKEVQLKTIISPLMAHARHDVSKVTVSFAFSTKSCNNGVIQYDGSKDNLDWRIDFKYLSFICFIKFFRFKLI